MAARVTEPPFTVRPIGVVRSPFREKVEAPRQAIVARDVPGTLVLHPEHEHALADLAGFERIWVLFWFHLAEGSRAKVLPPRSEVRRGVFATRSPHRPNPIGLSAVRLERIEGLVLYVRDLDLLDGTPVLDLKPYLPYADAFPDATAGWLEAARDPRPRWEITFSPLAEEQLAWIAERSALDLRARVEDALALGPEPHPYRRIKKTSEGLVLAVKDWRVRFAADGGAVSVHRIATGYRARELADPTDEARALQRAFVARFG
jgi:tRNA (adenine37-N6)-methyltransferase